MAVKSDTDDTDQFTVFIDTRHGTECVHTCMFCVSARHGTECVHMLYKCAECNNFWD